MQTIHPLLLHEVIEFTPIEGTYRFNRMGKFPWLQRICLWVLSKLDCGSGEVDIRIRAQVCNIDKLVELLLAQEEIVYKLFNKQVKYVLVGRDYYTRLINESADHMTLRSFEFSPNYTTNKYSIGTILGGIKVVFIPWMEGIVAVPELKDVY